MPEHYTRNTVSVTVWCNVCQRTTEHRVDDGRRGPCLEHAAKPTKPKKASVLQSGNLFDEGEK